MDQKPNHTDNGIVVLMPNFNDWRNIAALLPEIDRCVQGTCSDVVVVVVDDFSTDHPDPEMFSDLELATITECRFLKLKRNVGHQAAIAIGIGYIAKELPDRTLVVMDSDHEDKPEYIPLLVSTCLKSNKIVFANRAERSEGISFRIMYSIFKLLFRLLTGTRISFGNFSAVPSRAISQLAAVAELWLHYATTVMRSRIPFTGIPTVRGKRLHGASVMSKVLLIVHGLRAFTMYSDVVCTRLLIATAALIFMFTVGLIASILGKVLSDYPTWWIVAFAGLTGVLLGIGATLLSVTLNVLNRRTLLAPSPLECYSRFVNDEQILVSKTAKNGNYSAP